MMPRMASVGWGSHITKPLSELDHHGTEVQPWNPQ